MAVFTLLRLLYLVGADRLAWLFYIQTVAGASTVIALLYILARIIFGASGRVAAELGAVLATAIVTLIFADGLLGPRTDAWSIEYIPVHAGARYAILAVYVILPVALSLLAAWATHGIQDPVLRRRSLLFGASIVLMYVPNAVKYVTFIQGTTSLALAWIMAGGAAIGWQAYRPAAPSRPR